MVLGEVERAREFNVLALRNPGTTFSNRVGHLHRHRHHSPIDNPTPVASVNADSTKHRIRITFSADLVSLSCASIASPAHHSLQLSLAYARTQAMAARLTDHMWTSDSSNQNVRARI
jgi:hypothetical protein